MPTRQPANPVLDSLRQGRYFARLASRAARGCVDSSRLLRPGRAAGASFPVYQCKGKLVVEIQIGENDRLDWALKQFRRRMIRSGLFKDMRRKRFYEKPSEARKAKSKAAQRRKHKDIKRARRASQF